MVSASEGVAFMGLGFWDFEWGNFREEIGVMSLWVLMFEKEKEVWFGRNFLDVEIEREANEERGLAEAAIGETQKL